MKKLRIKLLLTLLFFSLANVAYAQTEDSTTMKKCKADVQFGRTLMNGRLGLPISIHPDFPCSRLGKTARLWNNKIGTGLGFMTLHHPKVKVGLTIDAFVNLHDLDPGQFISWQLWRAHLGGSLYFEFPSLIPERFGRAVLKLGYAHESQHATDVFGYVERYMTIEPENFDNSIPRSFEYLPFQLNYVWKDRKGDWLVTLAPEYKWYFRSGTAMKWVWTDWDLLSSLSLEVGVHRRIVKCNKNDIFAYAHGFIESLNNNFVSSEQNYWGNRDSDPLIYRSIEFGVLVKHTSEARFSLFMQLSQADGRGLDFPIRRRGIGGGLKIFI